jgi:hypothetical protein
MFGRLPVFGVLGDGAQDRQSKLPQAALKSLNAFRAGTLSDRFSGVNPIYASLNCSIIRHPQPFPPALLLNLL